MGQWEEMRREMSCKIVYRAFGWSLGDGSICPACIVHYHGATSIRHSMFIISSFDNIDMEVRKSSSVLCFINRQLPAAYRSSIVIIHPCLSAPYASNANTLVLIHRSTTPISPNNARHLQ